jgi:hypothetical protein
VVTGSGQRLRQLEAKRGEQQRSFVAAVHHYRILQAHDRSSIVTRGGQYPGTRRQCIDHERVDVCVARHLLEPVRCLARGNDVAALKLGVDQQRQQKRIRRSATSSPGAMEDGDRRSG